MRMLSIFVTALCAAGLPGGAQAHLSTPTLLYLNFSTGSESTTRSEQDDATQNLSRVGSLSPMPRFTWPGLHEHQAAGRILERIHQLLLPFNILVTAERPERGPYVMAIVGGRGDALGLPRAAAGAAVLDCEDRRINDLVFVFSDAIAMTAPDPIEAVAVAVVQEFGHAVGLEHSTDPEDIMFSDVALRGKRLVDGEARIAGASACGRTRQNSYRFLLERLGGWPADSEKPSPSAPTSPSEPEPYPAAGCQFHPGETETTPLFWLLSGPLAAAVAGRVGKRKRVLAHFLTVSLSAFRQRSRSRPISSSGSGPASSGPTLA